MSTVNILVPGVSRHKFTGGLLCIFEYANGLADLGHSVNVIPVNPSSDPAWFDPRFNVVHVQPSVREGFARVRRAFGSATTSRARLKAAVKTLIQLALERAGKWGSYPFVRAWQIERLRSRLPTADITLATHYSTAIIAHLAGSGKKFYFAQHFEPFFAIDSDDPDAAYIDAWLSYKLPLRVIANSSWLVRTLADEVGVTAELCTNAIRQADFFPDGSPPPAAERFVVISYGGRGAKWKGFEEAARAMRLVREEIPNTEWRVFGDASLPPDNPIAPYTPLGFLTGAALRQAYSGAHVLVAPSWYESFPLFPLEAMACGVAVVTTPFGVEDYARDGRNALVVPPRDPSAMAMAVISLYRNEALRTRLIRQATEDAKSHTWTRSVATMAGHLGLSPASPGAPSLLSGDS